MKLLKKSLLFVPLFCLAACNPNNRVFQNNLYQLKEADLNPGNSLYHYQSSAQINRTIFVNTYRLATQPLSTFEQNWIKREQNYRKNDCQLNKVNSPSVQYYVCQYHSAPRTVIYLINKDEQKQIIAVKILIDELGLNPNQQQKAAEDLNQFTI